MAIYVHCPHCHEHVADVAEACPHCGAALPIAVVQALAAARGSGPPPTPFMGADWTPPPHVSRAPTPAYAARSSALRPWLAAALSLICGLGQFYNGQVVKGLVLLGGAAGIAAAIGLLGSSLAMVIAPLWWVYAVVDAYRVGRQG